MSHKFIAIEGVIGVGKTTLARLLQTHFDAAILLEVFEENPFLAHFYADRERYALQTQLFFLLSRYQQQYETVPAALQQRTLIADYTFAKDEIFAWLNLKDDELTIYGRVHAALADKLPNPDVIVYLRADHDAIMRRIALRDRPYERDMDPGYIRDLTAAYEAWLANLQDTTILTIDTNHLDFLTHNKDLAYIVEQIGTALEQTPAVRPSATSSALETPETGHLAGYQQFHRDLDVNKGFDTDLFFNYTCFVEEVGEIAHELKQIWRLKKQLIQDGIDPDAAFKQALEQHRVPLQGELADLLAYVLKLANLTGIDLESAYQEKMRHNLNREWHSRS